MIALWIVLGLVVLAALGAIVSYNRFITQKNLIKDAWANIDTELKPPVRPDPEPGQDGEGLRGARA